MFDNEYENTIKGYETLLAQYPIVLQAAQGHDGKAVNKRFCEHMEENLLKQNIKAHVSYAMNPYQYGHHTLKIWFEEVGHHDMLVDIPSCETYKVIEFNRFNYEKFEERVLGKKNYYERELERLREDMKTGDERLKKYNALIQQVNELADQFSHKFKNTHKYDFEKTTL